MKRLDKTEIAARNKENYLKAKEAFNNKRVDKCVLFYAPDHEVKSGKGCARVAEEAGLFLQT